MRTLSVASVALAVLMLSGCLPPPPAEPAPLPMPTPVFSSEAEALAAAERAYAAYLSVSDEIAADGGNNPDRLSPYVTSDWLEKEKDGFDGLRLSGLRIQGRSSFKIAGLGRYNGGEVTIRVCLDVSESKVIDASGKDVTKENRSEYLETELTFRQESGRLILDANDPINAVDRC